MQLNSLSFRKAIWGEGKVVDPTLEPDSLRSNPNSPISQRCNLEKITDLWIAFINYKMRLITISQFMMIKKLDTNNA